MITVAFYVQDFWLLLIASDKESVFTLLEFLNIINTYAQLHCNFQGVIITPLVGLI